MNRLLGFFKSVFTNILAYLGFVPPRIRRYDVVLHLLDQARRNAAVIAERAAEASKQPPPAPPVAEAAAEASKEPPPDYHLPGLDELLLYQQLETLGQYIAEHKLLPRGMFEETIQKMATNILLMRDLDQIAPRLDNVITLLEMERAVLAGELRSTAPKVHVPASAGRAVDAKADAVTTSPGKAAESPLPPGEKPPGNLPDEHALLWKIAEKLFDSWPMKIFGGLLVSAILLAGGGTLLIGGKSLELRKTLEEAGSKEASSIKTLAQATRDTVAQQTKTLLSDLDRQQTQINQKTTEINLRMAQADQQILDLQSRTKEIRDAAVKQVATDIRSDFATVEKQLRDDLEQQLTTLKQGDIHALQEKVNQLNVQVQALGKDIDDKQTLVTNARPKIDALTDVSANAVELKTQADAIPGMKKSADDALAKITTAEQAAQNANARVQLLATDVETRLRPQLDKILENEGRLGHSESELKTLADGIRKIGVDKASTQEILGGAADATGALNAISRRLEILRTEVADLEKRASHFPPVTPAPVKASLTEEDLDRDQWRTIQRTLQRRGFYDGRVDGRVGAATRNAIAQYQTSRNATANRILTPDQIGEFLKPPN